MGGISAPSTGEHGLARTIGFGNMAAYIAPMAGVPRIDDDHWDASEVGFVLYEAAQLVKRPAAHPGTLRTPKPRPFADATEIFQSNAALGALGFRNECLTDDVVDIAAKPLFMVCRTLQCTTDVFRTLAVLLTRRCSLLQLLPTSGVLSPTHLNLSSVVRGAIAGRHQVHHA
jgi:hypothetical protein